MLLYLEDQESDYWKQIEMGLPSYFRALCNLMKKHFKLAHEGTKKQREEQKPKVYADLVSNLPRIGYR